MDTGNTAMEAAMHRIMLFAVLFFAFDAYSQQKHVAIINTVDDGKPSIDILELNHLTDRLREIATKILPQRSYAVMTQQSILSLFATPEDMIGKCEELAGCLVKIGREIATDYIGQGRIGRLGNNLTIKVELYESEKGTLVSSFTGDAKDIYGLLSVLDEKAPDMFRRMPGVSGPLSIVGGITGLESSVAGTFDIEKHYLINLTTDPVGAALSFNGVPVSSCALSPCKVELPEGKIRIIAALEQYETADTTVSFVRNNQSVSIKLKPNFGVFEVKPAYSDGIGRNEQWNLTINNRVVSSMGNRLLPNKYKVKLNHRCYEDISFEIGINKGSHEVFDMGKHINLKRGGLVLSTERDGEPSNEPVFVNGKRVGETPFSGSAAVCSEIGLGKERVKANIRLKHNETVKHTHKMPDSHDVLDDINVLQINTETAEERQNREYYEAMVADLEVKQTQSRKKMAEAEKKDEFTIKIGWRIAGALHFRNKASNAKLLGKYYPSLEEVEEEEERFGWNFATGLTLSIRVSDIMAIVSEANYSYSSYEFCKGASGKSKIYDNGAEAICGYGNDNSINVSAFYHTIEVPLLLKFGSIPYVEIGYLWGFPISESATVKSGDWLQGNKINDDFSDFRVKIDQAIVAGFGLQDYSGVFGLRFIYHLEKLDKYATIESPFSVGIILGINFFRR